MLVGGDELMMMEDTNMLFVSGIWGMNLLARSIASCPSPNIPAAPPAAASSPSPLGHFPKPFREGDGNGSKWTKNSGISFPPDRRAVTCTAQITACERPLPLEAHQPSFSAPGCAPIDLEWTQSKTGHPAARRLARGSISTSI